jgi:MurNAc alpha-1-phosphate uridylyltransferase
LASSSQLPIPSDVPEVAMVFAAGFGKRMLPITNTIPKPLVKVAGKTLLDHALDQLASAGVKKAVVNSHHLAEILESHLQKRQDLPQIIISHEDEILETGGGIVKALPLLGNQPVFSVNSDIMVIDGKSHALKRLAAEWDAQKMDVLMLLQPTEKSVGYEGNGDFDLCADGRIRRPSQEKYPYVFTGIMIIKPEIFAGQKEEKFSLYRDFIQPKYMQKDSTLSRVYGLVHDGSWLHIGTPEGIELAERSLCSMESDNAKK